MRKDISSNKTLTDEEKAKKLEDLGNCWDWLSSSLALVIESSLKHEISEIRDLTEYRQYPLYSSAVAATPDIPGIDDDLYEEIALDSYLIDKAEKTYLLTVAGNSMVDIGIEDGSILIVERSRTS